MPTKEIITSYFKTLQDEICMTLENADGKGKFREDKCVINNLDTNNPNKDNAEYG